MTRTRLIPLPSYPFRTELTVRTTDLNYAGHLGNDRLVSLLHEARMRFLAEHGQDEMDCGGVAIIQTETAVNYLRQAFAGDRLLCEVAAAAPTRCGIRFHYRLTRPADGAGIALAETQHAGFDYGRERILPLGDAARRLPGPGA